VQRFDSARRGERAQSASSLKPLGRRASSPIDGFAQADPAGFGSATPALPAPSSGITTGRRVWLWTPACARPLRKSCVWPQTNRTPAEAGVQFGRLFRILPMSPNWTPAFAGVQKRDFRKGLACAGVRSMASVPNRTPLRKPPFLHRQVLHMFRAEVTHGA